MTLSEFIAAHNGKYLDYDGRYGGQCVDLIDFYCRDVLDIPIVWADAVKWYGQDNPSLVWTHNLPNNMPSAGDIVVWGANFKAGTGVNGHIAIAVGPINEQSFTSFDQNWGGKPCELIRHTYDGVIGWGRKKQAQGVPVMPPEQMPVGWSAWEKLPSSLDSLQAVVTPDGVIHLFGLGPDKAVYHTTYTK